MRWRRGGPIGDFGATCTPSLREEHLRFVRVNSRGRLQAFEERKKKGDSRPKSNNLHPRFFSLFSPRKIAKPTGGGNSQRGGPAQKPTRTEPSRSAGQQLTAAADRNAETARRQGGPLSPSPRLQRKRATATVRCPPRQPGPPLLPPRQNDNRRAGEESYQASRHHHAVPGSPLPRRAFSFTPPPPRSIGWSHAAISRG